MSILGDLWDRLYGATVGHSTGKAPDKNWMREYGKGGKAIDDFWRNASGQESYYEEQARIENDRYWQDYHENTGIDPEKALYPIKSGINMNNAGQQIPMMGISKGKRAINMLYGGQE